MWNKGTFFEKILRWNISADFHGNIWFLGKVFAKIHVCCFPKHFPKLRTFAKIKLREIASKYFALSRNKKRQFRFTSTLLKRWIPWRRVRIPATWPLLLLPPWRSSWARGQVLPPIHKFRNFNTYILVLVRIRISFESLIRIRIRGKSWIRIRIEVKIRVLKGSKWSLGGPWTHTVEAWRLKMEPWKFS